MSVRFWKQLSALRNLSPALIQREADVPFRLAVAGRSKEANLPGSKGLARHTPRGTCRDIGERTPHRVDRALGVEGRTGAYDLVIRCRGGQRPISPSVHESSHGPV